MQAIDENGVIFTYDATLYAWLLPDLVFLDSEGYEISFDNDQIENDFDSAMLSTLTLIALAEPTPVGEIILGTAFVAVYIYHHWEITTDTSENLDFCMDKYISCWVPDCIDCCHNCLTLCNKTLKWDSNKCPN